MPVEQVERLGARGPGVHRDDVAHHQVTHARRNVAEKKRQRLAETGEDGINAGVRVAAAGGDMAALAAHLLVGGVGDGRADGVGIGVLVADDVGGGRLGRGTHVAAELEEDGTGPEENKKPRRFGRGRKLWLMFQRATPGSFFRSGPTRRTNAGGDATGAIK